MALPERMLRTHGCPQALPLRVHGQRHAVASSEPGHGSTRRHHWPSGATSREGDCRRTGGATSICNPRLQGVREVTRWYWAIIGVWPARPVFFAMDSGLSCCINDLFACRRGPEEAGRRLPWNCRGPTSSAGLMGSGRWRQALALACVGALSDLPQALIWPVVHLPAHQLRTS